MSACTYGNKMRTLDGEAHGVSRHTPGHNSAGPDLSYRCISGLGAKARPLTGKLSMCHDVAAGKEQSKQTGEQAWGNLSIFW